MSSVIVLVGAGSIGQAIARRVGAGKHILLADLRQENAEAAAKTPSEAGFDVSTAAMESISTERRFCWRHSGRSSRAAAPAW